MLSGVICQLFGTVFELPRLHCINKSFYHFKFYRNFRFYHYQQTYVVVIVNIIVVFHFY